MGATPFEQRVEAVRRFNRFYTQQVGVLHEGLLESSFSLTEARVLYELAHRDGPTASALGRALGLDAGYLSRILRGFERRALLERRPAQADARQHLLCLTRAGQEAFATLDARSQADVGALLGRLSEADQGRLTGAMRTLETLLGAPAEPGGAAGTCVLRAHRPGDMGWVVQRHGALYAQEYGWDERFEALVAHIVARFVERLDPGRERCWIAERDGERVGSVFLVKRSPTVAQLRLLLVEPQARGLGIGGQLVDACVGFARQAGYRKVTLWTNSVLTAARSLYRQAGFRRVRTERHRSFGQALVGETWELALEVPRRARGPSAS
jgi:DNA-binding MarR family transcriptional regulator/N-acetylglutamate synthase-like GNAT family acetyltransferase